MLVVVDVTAPGERLVGDPDPALGRPVGEEAQLLGGERVVADDVRGDVRAQEQLVGAEACQHGELVLGPAQGAVQDVGRDALEVAERLVEVDAQAQIGRPPAYLLRAQRAGEQVVLEDLHAVEPGIGDRGELVGQRSAERHRGDGLSHAVPPVQALTRSARWASIRSASGSTPVKNRKAWAAWKTTIPPLSSVRQPSLLAWRSSSVSSGR